MKMEIKEIAAIGETDCICGACHGDFRNIHGYIYRWMHDKNDSRCVVATCNGRERIILTKIALIKTIAELLQSEVLSESGDPATPLCLTHYRQVHRLLHLDDYMYSDKKCHACHALICYCGETGTSLP